MESDLTFLQLSSFRSVSDSWGPATSSLLLPAAFQARQARITILAFDCKGSQGLPVVLKIIAGGFFNTLKLDPEASFSKRHLHGVVHIMAPATPKHLFLVNLRLCRETWARCCCIDRLEALRKRCFCVRLSAPPPCPCSVVTPRVCIHRRPFDEGRAPTSLPMMSCVPPTAWTHTKRPRRHLAHSLPHVAPFHCSALDPRHASSKASLLRACGKSSASPCGLWSRSGTTQSGHPGVLVTGSCRTHQPGGRV